MKGLHIYFLTKQLKRKIEGLVLDKVKVVHNQNVVDCYVVSTMNNNVFLIHPDQIIETKPNPKIG